MSVRQRYRELTVTLCALVAAASVAVAGGSAVVDGALLDLLVKARAMVLPLRNTLEESPVAVIALDKRSLEEPELAAYPRALLAPVWATVLEAAMQAGARAVGFDLLFAYSAGQFSPSFDRPFLAVLGEHRDRIVLARSATTPPAPPFWAALRNDNEALGLADVTPDPDGRYRRVRASYASADGETLPGFVSALLRRARAAPMPSEVLLAPRRHPESIPTYAVADVLRCAAHGREALRRAFSGKIVLVGGTLPDEDRKVSSSRLLTPPNVDGPPLHPCGLRRLGASASDSLSVPGVFLHAAAIEAVVMGRVTSTAGPPVTAGLAAGMAAFGAALGVLLAPWLAVAGVALIGLLLFAGATTALVSDLWIPLAFPLAALVGAPILAYVARYVVEERTRRRIQHAFSHYLSPRIVDRLARDPSALKLGGERREVTVMFADLSGFTALSGKVEPEVLTRKTNQYLAYIVDQVEATGGYVDKFIGDAVMALWGAPTGDASHGVSGVRAAMAAVARIEQARLADAARGEIGFSVKIGLNSGPAVVGNVGTEKRYNYTAVGETVNVASRLESVPGFYACRIVVGARTAELARDEILFRELDVIRVKGRETPLAVFEPLGERATATPEQIDRAQRFADALAHYRAMRFGEARAIWDKLASADRDSWVSRDGRGDPPQTPASTMAERARAFAGNPPPAPWDRVWTLTSK